MLNHRNIQNKVSCSDEEVVAAEWVLSELTVLADHPF